MGGWKVIFFKDCFVKKRVYGTISSLVKVLSQFAVSLKFTTNGQDITSTTDG